MEFAQRKPSSDREGWRRTFSDIDFDEEDFLGDSVAGDGVAEL
jgi:hypothetical protein